MFSLKTPTFLELFDLMESKLKSKIAYVDSGSNAGTVSNEGFSGSEQPSEGICPAFDIELTAVEKTVTLLLVQIHK